MAYTRAAPRLQQAVGKPAGGGAHVGDGPAVDIQAKGVQRRRQLEASPADIGQAVCDRDLGAGRHLGARLVHRPVVDGDLAGHDEPLGVLLAVGQALLHQQQVQPFFARLSLIAEDRIPASGRKVKPLDPCATKLTDGSRIRYHLCA